MKRNDLGPMAVDRRDFLKFTGGGIAVLVSLKGTEAVAASLEQQHPIAPRLGQPAGQHAAGTARANDDVVEYVAVLYARRHVASPHWLSVVPIQRIFPYSRKSAARYPALHTPAAKEPPR